MAEALALTRSGSYGLIPPNMSELRLVLLGNSWSQRSSVGNLLLGELLFNPKREPQSFQIRKKEINDKILSVISSPQQEDLTADKQSELIGNIAAASAPGPHVFLLVLQPEDFTEQHSTRLQSVLESFSEQAFHHSLVLLCAPQEETPGLMDKYMRDPHIMDMIMKCSDRYLWMNTFEDDLKLKKPKFKELLSNIHQVVNENSAKHLECGPFVEPSSSPESLTNPQQRETVDRGAERGAGKSLLVKTSSQGTNQISDIMNNMKIALVGKTGCGKSATANTILGRKEFESRASSTSITESCKKAYSDENGRRVTVVDTPGLFDSKLSNEEVTKEITKCITFLAPGPHVFLLVIQIGRFTQEEKGTVKLIKEAFGKGAEKYTMILFTRGDDLEEEETPIKDYLDISDPALKELIADCGNRFHVFNNKEKRDRTQVKQLLKKINDMVEENGGSHYTNEMLQEAEADIQEETERIMKENEEEIRRKTEEIEKRYQQKIEEKKQKGESVETIIQEKVEETKTMTQQCKDQAREQAEESTLLKYMKITGAVVWVAGSAFIGGVPRTAMTAARATLMAINSAVAVTQSSDCTIS